MPGEPAKISLDVGAGAEGLIESFIAETKKATNCEISLARNEGPEAEIGGVKFGLAVLK
jgi:hypothetical protein